MSDTRGWCGIVIVGGKTVQNTGTLWRSANLLGASFIATIARRYTHERSDTMKTPKHIPLWQFDTFAAFMEAKPDNANLVAVETKPITNSYAHSEDLCGYVHPERAIYLLGAEDYGLVPEVLTQCEDIVWINTDHSLNVAVAGSIVLYDRAAGFYREGEQDGQGFAKQV